jgi:hypothetical protein
MWRVSQGKANSKIEREKEQVKMPRFVVVNPRKRTIEGVTFDSVIEAQESIGLHGVDHGVICRGLGYCVYEFGLFVPVAEQHYFGIGGQLIAGPAVFYGYDQAGETIDLRVSEFPDVRFFLGINDVENAIHIGEVERPFMAVNGVELWHWPQPAPEGMKGDVGG